MREQFKQIIRDLRMIKQEEQLTDLNDNMLFDGAVRIYNSILINRQQEKKKVEQQQTLSLPLTDKQKKLLEKLHYTGKMELTKAEANKIIQQFLEKQKQMTQQH